MSGGGGLRKHGHTSDGDGGAITSATRASLGLATSDSPQFAGVNVGNASDTTITRTGAGDVAVEGNALYRAGGTDVPITDGGTGASIASAARSNLGISAANTPITDTGSYFTGTDVEAALQELGAGSGGGTTSAPFDHGAMGAAETLALSDGDWHRGTLSANCTITVSGFTADVGASILFKVTQDAATPRAITWDSDVVFSGDDQPDQTLSSVTWYTIWSDEGDSTIYAVQLGSSAATRASLGLDTTDSPEFTGINLGHASDTTLTRVSSGVVAIEGTNIVKAGAATGSGLTMATARLLGRTTASSGAIEEISVGSGLSLSGGSLSATGGSSDLAGKDLDYVERTTNATITATSSASPDAVLSGASVAYDGSTVIEIEFFCPIVEPPSAQSIYAVLYDGSTELGYISRATATAAAQRFPMIGKRRLTPSNASHTYHIKGFVDTGTGTFFGGGGAAGQQVPAFMRITRVTS